MNKTTLSFEFFPPRTEAQSARFWRTLGCLETVSPEWYSVTYGALGSASEASVNIVGALQKASDVPVAAHLTCAGQNRAQLLDKLAEFKTMGVNRIVALRGDKTEADANSKYHNLRYANELVELIAETGDFDVSVAAYPEVHPEAESANSDMQALKDKLDAGASRALTQFFFEPEIYIRWRDAAVKCGIDKPLVPGILPIHDIDKVLSFSRRCGATVPPALVEQFRCVKTDEDKHALSLEHSVELCRTLKDEGVDSFHLYTLNQSTLSFEVSNELLRVNSSVAAA